MVRPHLNLSLFLTMMGLVQAGILQHLAAKRTGEPQQAWQQILAIAPRSASCEGARANPECSTAQEAAPHLIQAMLDYEIYDVGEIGAVIALEAFESVEFQFRHNVEPGRPGQGTTAMLMPPFVVEFARSFPALRAKVDAISTADAAGMTDAQLNAILDLVKTDEYTFHSAAWFLVTKCDTSVRDALKRGTDEGWNAYMTKCVRTTNTPERIAYWTRAKAAFGIV